MIKDLVLALTTLYNFCSLINRCLIDNANGSHRMKSAGITEAAENSAMQH